MRAYNDCRPLLAAACTFSIINPSLHAFMTRSRVFITLTNVCLSSAFVVSLFIYNRRVRRRLFIQKVDKVSVRLTFVRLITDHGFQGHYVALAAALVETLCVFAPVAIEFVCLQVVWALEMTAMLILFLQLFNISIQQLSGSFSRQLHAADTLFSTLIYTRLVHKMRVTSCRTTTITHLRSLAVFQ